MWSGRAWHPGTARLFSELGMQDPLRASTEGWLFAARKTWGEQNKTEQRGKHSEVSGLGAKQETGLERP